MIGQYGGVATSTGGVLAMDRRCTHDSSGRMIACAAALTGPCTLPAGHYGPHVLARRDSDRR